MDARSLFSKVYERVGSDLWKKWSGGMRFGSLSHPLKKWYFIRNISSAGSKSRRVGGKLKKRVLGQ
jgi:hypothetical protein